MTIKNLTLTALSLIFWGLVKLFNSKLEKLITKRVFVLYLLLVVLELVFLVDKWDILIGLSLGSIFGLLKLNTTSRFLSKVLTVDVSIKVPKISMVIYLIIQFVTLALLITSIKYSLMLFAGMTVGVLLVPFIILIVSFEQVILKHNNIE